MVKIMKKRITKLLLAFGFVFALSSTTIASAATVQAPPICKPDYSNAPCVPKDL
jgi:hypothetical protein